MKVRETGGREGRKIEVRREGRMVCRIEGRKDMQRGGEGDEKRDRFKFTYLTSVRPFLMSSSNKAEYRLKFGPS